MSIGTNKSLAASVLVLALPFGTAIGAASAGWYDAGASASAAASAAVPGVERAEDLVHAGWMDSGAAREGVFEAYRRAAREAEGHRLSGESLVALWESEKLAANPESAFQGWRLRFADAEGRVARITEYEVGEEGSRESSVYGLLRGKGTVVISRRDPLSVAPAEPFASMTMLGTGWRVTSAAQRSLYTMTADGGFLVEREVFGRRRVEAYLPGGRSVVTEGGGTELRGSFGTGESAGTWVERRAADEKGLLDRRYWYRRVEDDSISLSVDEVEPEARLRLEGA
ncbi:MAG: hypothetical protein WCL50_13465, partial [Spirochaetota bacterium]